MAVPPNLVETRWVDKTFRSFVMLRKPVLATTVLMPLWGTVVAGCGTKNQGAETADLSSRGPSSLAAGSTMEAIQRRGTIRIGSTFDQPLFGEKGPDGQPHGFDVEIAKLVARAIFGDDIEGRIQFVETPSKERESAIMEGKVDIVAGRTRSRTSARSWSRSLGRTTRPGRICSC